eukprot:UN19295
MKKDDIVKTKKVELKSSKHLISLMNDKITGKMKDKLLLAGANNSLSTFAKLKTPPNTPKCSSSKIKAKRRSSKNLKKGGG